MKFKDGDNVLVRGKVVLANDDGKIIEMIIAHKDQAVIYPADIPMPDQPVWVRDWEYEDWSAEPCLFACYVKYDEYPYYVYYNMDNKSSLLRYRFITTENPHRENSIELPKGKYSIETLKNLIAEHEK
jgi:hypothetical protein